MSIQSQLINTISVAGLLYSQTASAAMIKEKQQASILSKKASKAAKESEEALKEAESVQIQDPTVQTPTERYKTNVAYETYTRAIEKEAEYLSKAANISPTAENIKKAYEAETIAKDTRETQDEPDPYARVNEFERTSPIYQNKYKARRAMLEEQLRLKQSGGINNVK